MKWIARASSQVAATASKLVLSDSLFRLDFTRYVGEGCRCTALLDMMRRMMWNRPSNPPVACLGRTDNGIECLNAVHINEQ